MIRTITLLLSILIYGLPLFAEEKPTSIKIRLDGYTKDNVYIDFMEEPDKNMEFPFNDGEEICYEVKLDKMTMIKVNSFVSVFICPGENVEMDIKYENNKYVDVTFIGTPESVLINTTLHKMRTLRLANKYKTNIRAAVVVLTPVDTYFNNSMTELTQETDILNKIKDNISQDSYNFLLSEYESLFFFNAIHYPLLAADYMRLKIDSITPDAYWTMLDNYKLRSDDASLRNAGYMSFLLTYKTYMQRRASFKSGQPYKPSQSLTEEFNDVSKFYDGTQRDAALYVLLYNAISQEGDFTEIDSLFNTYVKQYNKNKRYAKTLQQIMQ